MSEIPGPVWIGVGVFVGGFSLFLGFINKVSSAPFFQLMTFVGLGMVLFGFIKLKFPKKSKDDLIAEMSQRRAQRGTSEYDIDIDDYRNNPQLRKEAMQNKQNFQQRYSNPNQQHHATQPVVQHPTLKTRANPTAHKHSSKTAAYCSQCGSPLMKGHKFCPICGSKT